MFDKFIRRFTLISSLIFFGISFQPAIAEVMESSVVPEITTNKININSADIDQLSLIKGIGIKKAQAIVDYRTSHGKFTTLEEVVNVKGIGKGTLKKIMPYLTL